MESEWRLNDVLNRCDNDVNAAVELLLLPSVQLVISILVDILSYAHLTSYIHTSIYAYINAYIHAYIQTYIHTSIHTLTVLERM